MFKQSRKKIILAIMGSLLLLLAATLTVIMLASYREIRRQNMQMLQRHAERYSLRPGPGEPGEPGEPEGKDGKWDGRGGWQRDDMMPPGETSDYKLSTFYSVAVAEDGTVMAVDCGEQGIYGEEELTALAKEIIAAGKTSGRTGALAFLTAAKDGFTLVAFMDNTVTENGMKTMLHNVLIIGGASLAVLFFLSLWLSKRIIRPLEENDKQQKQFISDASHELKTPVAVIDANAELLSWEIGENEWLANIRYENDRMGELVRQLLDLSRAENAELPAETADLSRIVTGECLAFESLAFDREKTILSEIGEGIQVTGSETQLAQLVSVLLDNAVRHSAGKEIGLSLRREGHEAVLEVVNEGEEIPPEKQAHLFDRFYRADEARTDEGQHYGLGLAIAKAVAEKHGGSIGVSCADGKVTFTVTLPAKK